MAIIKCKMCGGDLELIPNSTVCRCEFCQTQQTVPMADNEKKLALFGRANKLRAACDFDKAHGIFESIVVEYPDEAEAYWGLVLCKYGIEYVDDPATGNKIPTCHRSSFESVMTDSNFEQVLENADPEARKVYREEAKAIEELRKSIIAVSSKEEPYDIFICYKETALNGERSEDSVHAFEIYQALTREGYRVFFSRITLEDKLGMEYEPYIFAALNSAKIMLVVGTDYEHFNAVWVKNEWSRFLKLMAKDYTKYLIPCYKGIDAYDMPPEFSKFQAQDLSKIGATQDLIRGIEKLMGKKQTAPAAPAANDPTATLLASAETYVRLNDYVVAESKFKELTDKYPHICQGWWGRVVCATRDLTNINVNISELNKWMLNAKKTAKNGEYANMEARYLEFLNTASDRIARQEEQNVRNAIERHNQRRQQILTGMTQQRNAEEDRKQELANTLTTYRNQARSSTADVAKGKVRTTWGIIKIVIAAVPLLIALISALAMFSSGFSLGLCIVLALFGWLGWKLLRNGIESIQDGKRDVLLGHRHAADCETASKRATEEDQLLTQRYNNSITSSQKEIAQLSDLTQKCEQYLQLDFARRKERCYTESCQAIGVTRDYDQSVQQLYDSIR